MGKNRSASKPIKQTAPQRHAGRKSTPVTKDFQHWLNSYSSVNKWMSKFDLEAELDRGAGFCRLSNFFPQFVADGALSLLENTDPTEWNVTEASQSYAANNIEHSFWSTKTAVSQLELITRAISMLLPESLNTFSAARYDRDHHIAPHDDRAYTKVWMAAAMQLTYYRRTANFNHGSAG